jgi:haloalkane dehalogenase
MKYAEVLGSRMAYVDEGHGSPVLFQHGNPTSSYIWRNVIPHVAPHARCIAPDLIGFGQSDKPNIAYRAEDHSRYFDALMDALDLDGVVLVLHDWGSALGLDWARRHPGRVRGLVLMELIWPIPTWADLSPQRATNFKLFRDPEQGRRLLIDENRFVEQVLPNGVVRGLTAEELDAYRRPFLTPAHREPVYRFPNELPIAGSPIDVYAMVNAYHDWLLETDVPKLFFWAEPGALISPERAAWYQKHLKGCRSVGLGAGRHYMQEDHADTIGKDIASWLATLP